MRCEVGVRLGDGFVEGDLGRGAGLYYDGTGGVGEDAIAGRDAVSVWLGVKLGFRCGCWCLLAGCCVTEGLEASGIKGLLRHGDDAGREID